MVAMETSQGILTKGYWKRDIYTKEYLPKDILKGLTLLWIVDNYTESLLNKL